MFHVLCFIFYVLIIKLIFFSVLWKYGHTHTHIHTFLCLPLNSTPSILSSTGGMLGAALLCIWILSFVRLYLYNTSICICPSSRPPARKGQLTTIIAIKSFIVVAMLFELYGVRVTYSGRKCTAFSIRRMEALGYTVSSSILRSGLWRPFST